MFCLIDNENRNASIHELHLDSNIWQSAGGVFRIDTNSKREIESEWPVVNHHLFRRRSIGDFVEWRITSENTSIAKIVLMSEAEGNW